MAERPKYPANAMEQTRYLITEGKVMYFSNMYVGNPDRIGILAELAETPEFLAQYPDHHVFAIDEEIIVATPRPGGETGDQELEAARAALRGVLDKRGITEWNCALIQTGRRREIRVSGDITFTLSSIP